MTAPPRRSFFDQLFGSLAESGRQFIDRRLRAARPANVDGALALCQALVSERGEASGAALAWQTLATYEGLDEAERLAFFGRLREVFDRDPAAVDAAIEAYRATPSDETLRRLERAVESPLQESFRRLNMAPGGTASLVRMRALILARLREQSELAGIDADLAHLFRSWFNRGFLALERIDWRSPAAILEKIIRYEAVHTIDGWDDLRLRLADDRRCFAFFHPALPDEPLIFVEVALVKGVSNRIGPLIARDRAVAEPAAADTAVFYSINDCQKGLRGISFGNFLIKQVAAELAAEFPAIRAFATLSPVPGFLAWLRARAETVAALPGAEGLTAWLDLRNAPPPEPLREPLTRLAAYYLTRARTDGRPADPVARFHLRNGARLDRINWAADLGPTGLAQSAGIMVNYSYVLDQVERNHEAYVNQGKVVASREVAALARQTGWPETEEAEERDGQAV